MKHGDYLVRYRPTGKQYEYGDYGHDEEDEALGYDLFSHCVETIHLPTNEMVGEMLYNCDGQLFQVNVNESHQGKGIGEMMVRQAYDLAKVASGRIPMPCRSVNETDDGELFAESMIRKGYLRDYDFVPSIWQAEADHN